jgi:hypothetical protein
MLASYLRKVVGEGAPLGHIPGDGEATAGFGRGMPFDWSPYFDGDHDRTPEGVGGETNSPAGDSTHAPLFKASPHGLR